MLKPSIDTIVWDLDNTLWDWVTYAVNTYPAMRDLLARRTGATRDRVSACMRNFYDRAGTVESSWLVQDLGKQGLFDKSKIDENGLICAVQRTFHAKRQKYLRIYRGFPEVLKMAIDNGVSNYILTDAPARHATSRLQHLGFDQSLFRQMFALADSLPEEVTEMYRPRYDGGQYGLELPVGLANREKPDTDLKTLLGMTADEIRKRVAIVGDNYQKDMTLANRLGCLGIHAKWGRASRQNLFIVSQLSSKEAGARSFAQHPLNVTYPTVVSAYHPLDIPGILDWK